MLKASKELKNHKTGKLRIMKSNLKIEDNLSLQYLNSNNNSEIEWMI